MNNGMSNGASNGNGKSKGMSNGLPGSPAIAYFSMEIGIDPVMPTYSGGLGVLAGDSLRAAADIGLPVAAVSLVHRMGYFHQKLDARGRQTDESTFWHPEDLLEELPVRASVTIDGRAVGIRIWQYRVVGVTGHVVPIYFLDTALSENDPRDQELTDHLYGGDERYRLCQEALLGIGGIAALRALGHADIRVYHMNEGHSALLTLALLREQTAGRGPDSVTEQDIEAVRGKCVFTIHTPVPAGHDRFPLDMVYQVLGAECTDLLEKLPYGEGGALDLTCLALQASRSTNAVSTRHTQVSRAMFPGHRVVTVSNGVDAGMWTSESFARIYDEHFPQWRRDTQRLRSAATIELPEVQQAHAEAKAGLCDEVAHRTGVRLDPAVFTIGFARRATGYKRADLLFWDMDRLRRIVSRAGRLQVLYAGKAHPRDEAGKALIERVYAAAEALKDCMTVMYLEDYDIPLAKYLVAGVDLWLNTPQKPLEASGTSGMKAALNGVPSLSVVDGWWVTGLVEGVTGWAIGDDSLEPGGPEKEAASLYDKLEYAILPMFYKRPASYARVMRSAIALNASFFNAQRMMYQYLQTVYNAGEHWHITSAASPYAFERP